MHDEDMTPLRSEGSGTPAPYRTSGRPEDFDTFYETRIRPALHAHEAGRAALVRRVITCRWIAGMVIAGAMGAALIMQSVAPLIAGIFCGLLITGFAEAGLRRLSEKTKSLMAIPIADYFGMTFIPSLTEPASIHRHRSLGLVPGWDRASYEDGLSGTHEGVDFELYEAHLEERRTSRDSKGRTRTKWVTVFRGQCLRMAFQKTFHGRTLMTRDAGFFNHFGESGRMKRARLEDPVFEKIFEVYTSDQVECRYLLTPDIMQSFVDLEHAFPGSRLRACFDSGDLLITLQAGDLFEPGSLFAPLEDPVRLKNLINDFRSVFRIIEKLGRSRTRRHGD